MFCQVLRSGELLYDVGCAEQFCDWDNFMDSFSEALDSCNFTKMCFDSQNQGNLVHPPTQQLLLGPILMAGCTGLVLGTPIANILIR